MQLTLPRIMAERHALLAPYRIATAEQCLTFVQNLGFCYAFTPGDGDLPALFSALDTTDEDTRWHWVWGWKDELALARRCYYGRVIQEKPSFVANHLLPLFYALTGNVGEEDDHRRHFAEGRLTPLAVRVYEHIASRGPTDSGTLRAQFIAQGKSSHQLDRALAQLSELLLIARSGVQSRGRNRWQYIWDLFTRHLPEAAEAGAAIPSREAAAVILERYLQLVCAQEVAVAQRMFGWERSRFEGAVRQLEAAGRIRRGQIEGLGDALICHPPD